MKKILMKASSYYWEKAKGIDLAERYEKGKLSFMLLNQPPLCDAHCRRCFMPKERRSLAKSSSALDLGEWKEIIRKGKEKGVLSLELSGEGEPLLSENTLPIIRYANSIGIITTLITTGHALNEGLTKALFEEGATLVFSLHSLDAEKYEKDNECPESYRIKMRAIETAARIFTSSSYHEKGYLVQRLAIHATLQADNLGEVEDLRRFCNDRNMFFSIAPLARTGNAVLHPELHVDREITEVTSLGDNSIIHSETSARIYGREVCGTAAFGMSIGFDGNLLPDAHGGYEIGHALGNVRIYGFDELFEIWRRMAGRMFRETEGFCPVRDEKRFSAFVSKLVKENNVSSF